MKVAKQIMLPDGYKPQPQEILSGRSRESYNHDGNKEFRITIALQLPMYLSLKTRRQRYSFVASILGEILSNGGRFLERKNNRWVVLTQNQAHKKIAHAFRDSALRYVARHSRVEGSDENFDVSNNPYLDTPLRPRQTEPPVVQLPWTEPRMNAETPLEVQQQQQQQRPPPSLEWWDQIDAILNRSLTSEFDLDDDLELFEREVQNDNKCDEGHGPKNQNPIHDLCANKCVVVQEVEN